MPAAELPPLPSHERSLGYDLIHWLETYLVHGPGDIQGAPYRLDIEQMRFIVRAYEIDSLGRRKVRRGVFSRPKGRAKSELAAALAVAEALGPVRFDGWDADGLPVGRPVTRPEIVSMATELGQAGNVYSAIHFMLSEGPLADTPGLDVGLLRVVLPDGGKIIPATGAAGSKDGQRPTFVIADETHLMKGRELRELHAVQRRNLAKRKAAEPWMLETTTAFMPGEDSVAEASWRYHQSIVDGKVKDSGFLFDHREGFSTFDWEDDEQLLASLAEAYGEAAAWMDLDRIVAEIRDPMTEEAEARRYFLNIPSQTDDAWIDVKEWNALPVIDGLPAPGTAITLGFDGSIRDDSTALIGCVVNEGGTPHIFVVKVWENDGRPGWEVDRADVDMVVRDAFDRWDVKRMYADPPQWQDHVDTWTADLGNVFEWWTNRRAAMVAAIERFETAVKTQEMSHDGNKTLTRHVLNARVREVTQGRLISKDRPKSPDKIDAAVAAVLAVEARADVVAAGLDRRSRRLVSF